MKVLFLRNSRGITDVTGAETYLLTVMAGLMRAGCDVHLICSDIASKGQTAWLRALSERAIPHEVVDVPRTFSTADFRAAVARCRSFRPDVIHAMDHRADAVGVWAANQSGIPAVASFFGWTNWPRTSFRGRIFPVVDRFLMRRLRKVIVDSSFVGQQIRSSNPSAQIAVIPNGVDMVRFDPDRVQGGMKSRWFGDEDVWLVGMIGRLHPNKGHMDMVNAATALIRDHPKMRFVVLGDAPSGYEPFANTLRDALVQKGLEKKFVITNAPSTSIPSAIASFDVTAIPSHMESLSYVLLESMAMGKPVVSARVGGHGEVIDHGRNGFLHPPGDIPAMAGLLADLCADPSLGPRIGAAGQQTVRDGWSVDAMVARTKAVYKEVTA